jgi:hypothetical protein
VVDKATSTTGSLVLKYGITTLAPPTLDPINNPSPIGEAASLQTVNFSGTGASPPANTLLTVTASSSNPGLIPSPTVNYTSPSATGSLSYTPVANASGSAMITVTVRDAGQDGFPGNGDDGTTNRTFTVVVNPTNDRPRFISHSLSGGTFQFRLVGNPGSIFVIETSGTLTNWTALSTNSAPSGSFDGSVPVTTTRYLRARLF